MAARKRYTKEQAAQLILADSDSDDCSFDSDSSSGSDTEPVTKSSTKLTGQQPSFRRCSLLVSSPATLDGILMLTMIRMSQNGCLNTQPYRHTILSTLVTHELMKEIHVIRFERNT